MSHTFARNVQRAKNAISKIQDETGFGRTGIRAGYRRYKTKKKLFRLYKHIQLASSLRSKPKRVHRRKRKSTKKGKRK